MSTLATPDRRRSGPARPDMRPTRERANPFVGPRSLHEGERVFGRKQELAEIRALLLAQRIVLVYSPSGAGKTSLIEAGLRPHLRRRGFVVLPTIRVGSELDVEGIEPTNRYRASVIASLEERLAPPEQLRPEQVATMTLADYFGRIDAHHFATTDEGAPTENPCFIFDQFEELFTLDSADYQAKAHFLSELGAVLEDRSRWALFAMREDFIAQLDPYLSHFPAGLRARFRLGLLGVDAARQAMIATAAIEHVDFDEIAADRLVDDLRRVQVERRGATVTDLGPHVEPVQLQVACRSVWSQLGESEHQIEPHHITTGSGVDQALGEYYDNAVREVAGSIISRARLRRWFGQKLIGRDGYRNQVRGAPGSDDTLQQLVDRHLIRAETRRGTSWYELTHDRFVAPILTSNRRFTSRWGWRLGAVVAALLVAGLLVGASIVFPRWLGTPGPQLEELTVGETIQVALDDNGLARYEFDADRGDVFAAVLTSADAGNDVRLELTALTEDELGAVLAEARRLDAVESQPGTEVVDEKVDDPELARLDFQFAADGTYVVEIMASPEAALELETTVEQRDIDTLVVNRPVEVAPASAHDVFLWEFLGEEGETVTVDLRPLDPSEGEAPGRLMRLLNERAIEIELAQVDPATGSTSVVSTLPASGLYYVEVSASSETAGRFELELTQALNAGRPENLITLDEPLVSAITDETTTVTFLLETNARQSVEVVITPTGALDATIELIDPAGNVTSIDRAVGGAWESALVTTVDGGVTTIEIGGFQGSEGGFVLEASAIQSTALSPGVLAAGQITVDAVRHVLWFEGSTEPATIQLQPSAGFDPVFLVWGPLGPTIAIDSYAAGHPEAAVVHTVPGFIYHVDIFGFDGSTGRFRAVASEAEPRVMAVGGSVNARVDGGQVAHAYLVEIDRVAPVAISVRPDADFDVIVDAVGPGLFYQSMDVPGEGGEELLVFLPAQTGTHLIAVRPFDGSTGRYDLNIGTPALTPSVRDRPIESAIPPSGRPVTFDVHAQTGDVLRLVVSASAGLQARIDVNGPIGLQSWAAAAEPGESISVDLHALLEGRYFATVHSVDGSTGDFTLEIETG